MSGDRFVVVGDLINDVVAAPRGPVRVDTDTSSTIRPRPGGSAANTACWLGTLNVGVDFVGAVGSNDDQEHVRILREAGVEPHLQVEYGVPTGMIVIVVEGEHRTMYTERGANALLDTAAVTPELLASARVLHISAYSILDGFGTVGARDLIGRATAAGVPVAVNPGSSGYLQDFGVDSFLTSVEGASILFPNLAEASLLTGTADPEQAIAALLRRFETVVLTLGPDGCLAGTRGRPTIAVPAPRVRLVDPTGAGDAFAAGFLERWYASDDLAESAVAATKVAARAVMTIGGRPPL